MKITKIIVDGHSGENKQPASGSVWFDDGKSYFFTRDWTPEATSRFFFSSYRKRPGGGHNTFNFRSPARDAVLCAYLEV